MAFFKVVRTIGNYFLRRRLLFDFGHRSRIYSQKIRDSDPEIQDMMKRNAFYLQGSGVESIFGNWFSNWDGNIEEIDHKKLLNKMVSLGLFNRK